VLDTWCRGKGKFTNFFKVKSGPGNDPVPGSNYSPGREHVSGSAHIPGTIPLG
jgi:hypothetical protein